MDINASIEKAVSTLQNGGIIAYPTEAVYGLGCDPFNEKAVANLLKLKHRSIEKGFILISHTWERVINLTLPIDPYQREKILSDWPGAYTWAFPANLDKVPAWIRGNHKTIALRITAHPIASMLCKEFTKPLVSTSANIEGEEPARTLEQVKKIFPLGIDYILEGEVGSLENPTPIYDAETGKVLRKS